MRIRASPNLQQKSSKRSSQHVSQIDLAVVMRNQRAKRLESTCLPTLFSSFSLQYVTTQYVIRYIADQIKVPKNTSRQNDLCQYFHHLSATISLPSCSARHISLLPRPLQLLKQPLPPGCAVP